MDGTRCLSGGGSWTLKPHEELILHAVIDHLDRKTQELIRKQLAQKYFIERVTDGRINVFHFYGPSEGLRIDDSKYADALYRAHIVVEGRRQIAHVRIYKGYIYSIETKKVGKFYKNAQVEVGQVELGKPSQSYTRVFDRFEHGREGP